LEVAPPRNLVGTLKELARVQAAIRHRDESELRWAVEYCRMKVRIATGKDDAKYWRGIEREVTNVLGSSSPDWVLSEIA